MEIKQERDGNTLTVFLTGRLDTNTSPELETHLRENMGDSNKLIIDLENTQYVSSAGLRVFLSAHKQLAKTGGEVVIRHANEYIADVLDATGFTDFMTVEEQREA